MSKDTIKVKRFTVVNVRPYNPSDLNENAYYIRYYNWKWELTHHIVHALDELTAFAVGTRVLKRLRWIAFRESLPDSSFIFVTTATAIGVFALGIAVGAQHTCGH